MKSLLNNLNQIPGVLGSMVMTEDGMVVAEALTANLESEAVAAIASGGCAITNVSEAAGAVRSVPETALC